MALCRASFLTASEDKRVGSPQRPALLSQAKKLKQAKINHAPFLSSKTKERELRLIMRVYAVYTRENRYYKNSKISEYQFRRILKNFSLDLTATETAKMTGFSTRSINAIFIKIRYRVAEYCEASAPRANRLEREAEYLGPHETLGDDNALSGLEPVVFGLFYKEGCVYTEVVPKSIKNELIQALTSDLPSDPSSSLNGWPAYDGVLDLGSKKYFRGPLPEDQDRERHSGNGSESFWVYTKQRMSKFKGLRKQMFYLHLKETEFRFNHRHDSIYNLLMTLLRNHPI